MPLHRRRPDAVTLFDLDIPAEPKRPRRSNHPAKHLASKHPDGIRATWCRTCRAPILTGLDAEVCAFDARVDPTPLTALGEALALLAGRATFELRMVGHVTRIRRRRAHTITIRPAGAAARVPYDVVASHACDTPTADTLATTTHLPESAAARAVPDRAPY